MGLKEKIKGKLSTLEYKALKIYDANGKLSQEKFEKLLDYEFEQQLQDNPPIEGVFSPEEDLQTIRHMPRGKERQEALKDYKEKLVRQRKMLK